MNLVKPPSRLLPQPDGPTRLAALGQYSYSDEAARNLAAHYQEYHGQAVEVVNLPTIDEVWNQQKLGRTSMLIPLENTSSGLVPEHWRFIEAILRDPGMRIVATTHHHVYMCLCGVGNDTSKATAVASHFQALRQSSNMVGTSNVSKELAHAPVLVPGKIDTISTHEGMPSTVLGLKQVHEKKDPNLVGLGTRSAAEALNLNVHHDDASNLPGSRNVTQMLLLQRDYESREPDDDNDMPYHAVLLRILNRRGSLYEVLRPLADHGVNITAIHNKPPKEGEIQQAVTLFMEMDTSNVARLSKLKRTIGRLPHVEKPVRWQSWQDQLEKGSSNEPNGDVVKKHPPIDWGSFRNVLRGRRYKLRLVPKSEIGVLATNVGIISSNKGNLLSFNSKIIEPHRYAFEMEVEVPRRAFMNSMLIEFRERGNIEEISIEAL